MNNLWEEIDVLVKEGDKIIRNQEIIRDENGNIEINQKGDNIIREQLCIKEDLYHYLFPIPDPKSIEGISYERAKELLEQALECMKEYKPENLVFVEVEIEGIRRFRPQRPQESSSRELKISAFPTGKTEELFKQTKDMIREWAQDLSTKYDPFANKTDYLYRTIQSHIELHLGGNNAFTEDMDPHLLYAISLSIPQIKESVSYELNQRIYAEELLYNG